MKRIFAVLAFAAICAAGFCGGGSDKSSGKASSGKVRIGVSMPTQSHQRWNQDGANLKAQLEAQGYSVDLQYAGENDIPTQVAQIENMVMGNCKVIIIASIDGSALTEPLRTAKEHGASVIAYDRLIMNSDAVAYYATFDNYKVGVLQGEYIRDALDLENAEGPFYMELFAGPTDDNNTYFFWDGAMEILKPHLDSGKIVVPSGQVTVAQCATRNWAPEESQARMENLIASNSYGPDRSRLDIVHCGCDSVSNGVTTALIGIGYTPENIPLITGQDCDITSVKNMLRGTQSMSVFKDTRTLAAKVVEMVNAIVRGGEVSVNDTTTYDNGTGVIPSFLCDPVAVSTGNYREMLLDSGYYREAEIMP